MAEPVAYSPSPRSTYRDQMLSTLTAAGFATGSVNDRERARLVGKTGFDKGYSLADLYRAAGEPNRTAKAK